MFVTVLAVTLYKSEADLVEYSSGTQPNQGSCFQVIAIPIGRLSSNEDRIGSPAQLPNRAPAIGIIQHGRRPSSEAQSSGTSHGDQGELTGRVYMHHSILGLTGRPFYRPPGNPVLVGSGSYSPTQQGIPTHRYAPATDIQVEYLHGYLRRSFRELRRK